MKTIPIAIALAALAAPAVCEADLFPDCFTRSPGSEVPWLVFEPIDGGQPDSSDQLSNFFSHSAELATQIASRSLQNQQINLSLVMVNCSEKRRRGGVKLAFPSLDDFRDPTPKTFLAKNIVVVAWGDALNRAGGVSLEFAALPLVIKDTDPTPRKIVVPRPAQLDNDQEYIEDMKVVPVVGVLARVDEVLKRVKLGDLPMIDSKNRCQLDTALSALNWAERYGASVLKAESNAWLANWLQDLKARRTQQRNDTPNALCVQ